VADLSWSESEIAVEFAGAVANLVGLSVLRPGRAAILRRGAVEKLDEQGRALVVARAAQINEEQV
jgi:hypothetical protein